MSDISIGAVVPETDGAQEACEPAVTARRAHTLAVWDIVDEYVVAKCNFGHVHDWGEVRRVQKSAWLFMQPGEKYLREKMVIPGAVLSVLVTIALLCISYGTQTDGFTYVSYFMSLLVGGATFLVFVTMRWQAQRKRTIADMVRREQVRFDYALDSIPADQFIPLPDDGSPLPPTVQGQATFIAYVGQK